MQSLRAEPDPANATCEMRTRHGALPDAAAIARCLAELRVGARLRGIEVTADGRLERRGPDLILVLEGSEERVRLLPLEAKVQLDVRRNQPRAPSREESLAREGLGRGCNPAGACLRVTGPLVRGPSGEMPGLEVRDYSWFSAVRPPALAVTIGIDVNGPYGLAEPWALIRDGLMSSGGWEWMAGTPDLETATFRARTADGLCPDLARLAASIRDLGAGASLRGVDVTVEGLLVPGDGRLSIRVRGAGGLLPLARLNRKVQWNGRGRQEACSTPEEAAALDDLRERARGTSGPVWVFGPLVQSRSGPHVLLEVRGFSLDASPGERGADLARERPKGSDSVPRKDDRSPPMPPRAPSAAFEHGQIRLSWPESTEPDLDAYSVFRSTTPGRGYIQIAAGIVPTRCAFRAGARGGTYYYVVTARDRSGNESGFSPEVAVSIPQP